MMSAKADEMVGVILDLMFGNTGTYDVGWMRGYEALNFCTI